MGWLTRLKDWATREPVGRVDDERLGPIVLNDGGADGCWVARAPLGGRLVLFEIGGRYEPDPALVARAAGILRSFDRFTAVVAEFLAAEAQRDTWSPFAAEIRSLVVRDVCLYWPRRPGDGMVFFDGPDADRCWRCDLIGEVPAGLGFDT